MKTFALMMTLALTLAACSAPAPKSTSTASGATASSAQSTTGSAATGTAAGDTARATGAATATPKCLNVQEGDRHVEFDGRRFLLAEDGRPKALALEAGLEVECERLEVLRYTRTPAVLIEYTTPKNGARTERKLAIASIKDAKWILKPTVLETRSNTRATEVRSYMQSIDRAGQSVITLIDSRTGQSQTLKP